MFHLSALLSLCRTEPADTIGFLQARFLCQIKVSASAGRVRWLEQAQHLHADAGGRNIALLGWTSSDERCAACGACHANLTAHICGACCKSVSCTKVMGFVRDSAQHNRARCVGMPREAPGLHFRLSISFLKAVLLGGTTFQFLRPYPPSRRSGMQYTMGLTRMQRSYIKESAHVQG